MKGEPRIVSMSNNPYEPHNSDSEPAENPPTEKSAHTSYNQVSAEDSHPTVPLNTYSSPQASSNNGLNPAAASPSDEANNPYASSAASQPASETSYPAGGAAYGATQQTNGLPYDVATPQHPQGKKMKNVLGIIALVVAILGFLMGLIPILSFIGWFFLFAGFVCGIIGLFQRNKEKITSAIAIAVSIIGAVASIVIMGMLFYATLNAGGATASYPRHTESSLATSAASSSGSVTSNDGILKFGETATYNDGLKFTVSQPKTDFKPSKSAAFNDKSLGHYVSFTITIENGTSEPYRPYGNITGSSGGKKIGQIFDSAQGISSTPGSKILPGDKVTYDVAFSVADPNQITLDVDVDSQRDEIIYTNK